MEADSGSERSAKVDILYSYFTKEAATGANPEISDSVARQLLGKPDREFKVLQEIGRGATGVVYKICDVRTKEKFAMKVIPVRHLSKPQQNQKLKEVLLMKGLAHPNIIHYIASYIEDDELCIIMEYAQLGDLAHREKNCMMTEKCIWDIFWQLALAVLHLHSHSLIHRDIKPLNVLLTLDSDRRRIAKVDIWALGCVLYELMALAPPFVGDTLPELFAAIAQRSSKPVSGPYSSHLQNLCMRLLAKNKDERPFIDQVLSEFPQSYSVSLISSDPISTANLEQFGASMKEMDRQRKELARKKFHNTRLLAAISSELTELRSALQGSAPTRKKSSIRQLLAAARREAERTDDSPQRLRAKPRSTSLCQIQRYGTIQERKGVEAATERAGKRRGSIESGAETERKANVALYLPLLPLSVIGNGDGEPTCKKLNLNVHHIRHASGLPQNVSKRLQSRGKGGEGFGTKASSPLARHPYRMELRLPKSPKQKITIHDLDL